MPNAIASFVFRRPKKQPSEPKDVSIDRLQAKAFYRSARWLRLRKMILSQGPLCVECAKRGRITPATDVDHVLARRDRPDLSFDADNLQTLCKACHSRKTRGEQIHKITDDKMGGDYTAGGRGG